MTAARSPRTRQSGVSAPARARSRTTARPLPQESAGPRLRALTWDRSGRRDMGWRAIVAVCIVGGFAALVVSVAIQSQRIALQEQADKIAAATSAAQDRNRELRIEVIQAESPEHLLEGARAAGLVEPGPIAVVPAVNSDRETVRRAPASSADSTADSSADSTAQSSVASGPATKAGTAGSNEVAAG